MKTEQAKPDPKFEIEDKAHLKFEDHWAYLALRLHKPQNVIDFGVKGIEYYKEKTQETFGIDKLPDWIEQTKKKEFSIPIFTYTYTENEMEFTEKFQDGVVFWQMYVPHKGNVEVWAHLKLEERLKQILRSKKRPNPKDVFDRIALQIIEIE